MKNKILDRDISVVFGDGQSVAVDNKSWISLVDDVTIDGKFADKRTTMISVHELLDFYIQNNTWVLED